MKNKLISVVLALLIVFSTIALMSVSVSAAGTAFVVKELEETASTVKVEVKVTGNTGLSSFGANLEYDTSLLEFQSIDVGSVSDNAGMAVFDSDPDENGNITITSVGGSGTKSNGTVFVATFKKRSSVGDGAVANVKVTGVDGKTKDLDKNPASISSGSANINLSTIRPTTTRTTPAPVERTTAKNNKKETTVKAPVIEPTTAETTTEEITTIVEEEITEEETFESYSYVEPETEEAEDEDADKVQKRNRIIAVAVIVVCVSAVAALIFTKKKTN